MRWRVEKGNVLGWKPPSAVFVYVSERFQMPCFIIYHFTLFCAVDFSSDAYFDVSSSVYAFSGFSPVIVCHLFWCVFVGFILLFLSILNLSSSYCFWRLYICFTVYVVFNGFSMVWWEYILCVLWFWVCCSFFCVLE